MNEETKNTKTALITGVSGQDGSYMAELLLQEEYQVFGIVRRKGANHNELGLAAHLAEEPDMIFLHGDVTDQECLRKILDTVQPWEIYHFAAQSHVGESFNAPELTMQTNVGGTLNLLLAAAEMAESRHVPVKLFNACSSEMFGRVDPDIYPLQDERTPFHARSPYGVSKITQFHLGQYFREHYRGVDVWNGITFNHESERRPADFVTRKVTQYVASWCHGNQIHVMGQEKPLNIPKETKLLLGNTDALRDWGYAPDFVKAFWLMLQEDTNGNDYVVATGETRSVWELVETAFKLAGIDNPRDFVEQDKRYLRPSDVPYLCGDSTRLRENTGWLPSVSFETMLDRMIKHDIPT